jgi:hypothetical protein
MKFFLSLASLLTVSLSVTSLRIQAQVHPDRCGTMTFLEAAIKRDPSIKTRMVEQETQLQQLITFKKAHPEMLRLGDTLLIPLVFHIVLPNPSDITDAQVQAQVDTLNLDYAGLNSDSVRVPSYFKLLFGHSTIRFALAKRTPDNRATTGIVRSTTTQTSFSISDDGVKSSSAGGSDPWNTSNYLNVWLCPLSGAILGYATLPSMTSMAPGVVVDYRSVPGGAYTTYNQGKTMTHEIGHFFNLYHIWGDDNGACWGTDYVDDTPNQGNSTAGSSSGVVTDACSPTPPGIMYQNYMDYTDDDAMEMFTVEQVARMEAAATTFRASLLTSPGAVTPVIPDYDAALKAIDAPASRLCSPGFTPAVTITNNGSITLTSLNISAQVDGASPVTINWKGSVAAGNDFSVSLPALTTTTGTHLLTLYTSGPDNVTDQVTANDTLHLDIVYNTVLPAPLSEGFEGPVYPPQGWDLVNEDDALTWEKAVGFAHTGSGSVVIRNFDDAHIGARDYLRLPQLTIDKADSGFMTFSVAAGMAPFAGPVFVSDTLEVLASTDCGASYTSLYKRAGPSLSTTSRSFTGEYAPQRGEWRKDSVNLTPYIGQGPFLLAFRNTNEQVNDIYLDDVDVYAKSVNPVLKNRGMLVTPNPASAVVNVDFYPAPANLKAIAVYSVSGSLVAQTIVGDGAGSTHYAFDLGRMAAGIYIVRVLWQDRVEVAKIVKE